MIVGGVRSLHQERALKRVIPDPVIREGTTSPQGTVYRHVAETSKEWKARLEAEDAKQKAEDERARLERRKMQHKGAELLREQIKEAEARKKEGQTTNKKVEVQASQRAQTRLLRDQEEQRYEKEKRTMELQVTRMKDKMDFDKTNAAGQEVVAAQKREERKRRASLAAHVQQEENEKELRKLQQKREEDQLRRNELLEQGQEKRLRERADMMDSNLRHEQDLRNQEHWSELERQHVAKRKKAAEATTRRQEDVAKMMLAEQMEKQQGLMQERLEHRPDPFTDRPGPLSPNTKRQTNNQYRGMLDNQISVRNALVEAEKNKEHERVAASTSGPNSARRLQHALW